MPNWQFLGQELILREIHEMAPLEVIGMENEEYWVDYGLGPAYALEKALLEGATDVAFSCHPGDAAGRVHEYTVDLTKMSTTGTAVQTRTDTDTQTQRQVRRRLTSSDKIADDPYPAVNPALLLWRQVCPFCGTVKLGRTGIQMKEALARSNSGKSASFHCSWDDAGKSGYCSDFCEHRAHDLCWVNGEPGVGKARGGSSQALSRAPLNAATASPVPMLAEVARIVAHTKAIGTVRPFWASEDADEIAQGLHRIQLGECAYCIRPAADFVKWEQEHRNPGV